MRTKRHVLGELDPKRFRVAIFGSARIEKKDKIYQHVYRLAESLGGQGIDVVTGGGPGLMEAAAAGHEAGSKKTKAKSIGLGIKLPKEQHYNKHLDYRQTFMRFTGRLDEFMLLSNAVVVSPGGVGTLLELFYTWQLVQVKHVSHIPIILLGKQWKGLLEWLRDEPLKSKYFTEEDYKLLFLAKDYKDAEKVIKKVYKDYLKGEKNPVNYDGYENYKLL